MVHFASERDFYVLRNHTYRTVFKTMMTLFGFLCSPVTSMAPKFSITDPMGSSFFEPYSATLKRNFNGAIWSGKIFLPAMSYPYSLTWRV